MHGSSVPGFIREHTAVLGDIPFALVTMVDSNPDVGQMPWAMPFTNSAQRSAGASLLLATATLIEVVDEEKVFHGFDEVWFSVNQDPARPVPGLLAAPRNLAESPLRPAEASTAVDMLLGLGDGYGLNFVAMEESVATRLGLRSG